MFQSNLARKNFPAQFVQKFHMVEKMQCKGIFSLTQEKGLLSVLTALKPFHKVATCTDILEKVTNK